MEAIVIGAGPAGLAVAACLNRVGLSSLILDRADAIGGSFLNQYDALRLHTVRGRSSLPFRAMPSGPRYPSRSDFIAYLQDYARRMHLTVTGRTLVTGIAPADDGWSVATSRGTRQADVVVLATGLNARPRRPDWPGLTAFPGPVLHAAEYRDAEPFREDRVLVVGFGNSAHDIAVDLARAGARPDLAVRAPVNVLPRELLGLPVTSLGMIRQILRPAWADRLVMPVMRLATGHPRRYGLRQARLGPVRTILTEGRVPLLDHGALAAIRAGRIGVRPGIERMDGPVVQFAGGGEGRYDALILATGYDVDLGAILDGVPGVLDDDGRPRISGGPTAAAGLYFCAYRPSLEGQIRQAGIEARAIATDIAGRAGRAAAA